eukprot:755728-Hanusia_phi.AAC.3
MDQDREKFTLLSSVVVHVGVLDCEAQVRAVEGVEADEEISVAAAAQPEDFDLYKENSQLLLQGEGNRVPHPLGQQGLLLQSAPSQESLPEAHRAAAGKLCRG